MDDVIKGVIMKPITDVEKVEKLVKPVVDFLNEYGHPHMRVIIHCDHVEVVEDVLGIPFEVKD